jgi:hypothetical protein
MFFYRKNESLKWITALDATLIVTTSALKQTLRICLVLVDNIFVVFGDKIFQQFPGIPMGTNCAPVITDFIFIWRRLFLETVKGCVFEPSMIPYQSKIIIVTTPCPCDTSQWTWNKGHNWIRHAIFISSYFSQHWIKWQVDNYILSHIFRDVKMIKILSRLFDSFSRRIFDYSTGFSMVKDEDFLPGGFPR